MLRVLRLYLVVSLLCSAGAHATECRFALARQSDGAHKLGFYLELAGGATSGACQLSGLKLVLGIGGGRTWQTIQRKPAWKLNTGYAVKVVVASGKAELWLNGTLLGSVAADFRQAPGSFVVATEPDENGVSAYLPIEAAAAIQSSSGRSLNFPFPPLDSRPPGLLVVASGVPQTAAWDHDAGVWTITASFRLLDNTQAHYAPLYDRYLQSAWAEYPGKIRSDSDLIASTKVEDEKLQEWGAPKGFDAYGGVLDAGWSEPGPAGHGSGFFRIVQHNGYWWLVTPLGNPCFYIGINTAPAFNAECTPVDGREKLFAELPPTTGAMAGDLWRFNAWPGDADAHYACFNAENLLRKYGPGWKQEEIERTRERVRAWGYSGLGKWSNETADLAAFPVLSRDTVPQLLRHPDIFDPQIRSIFRRELSLQIEEHQLDPRVVGWSVGNEFDEIVTPEEVVDILKRPATLPAKRALVDEALRGIYAGKIARLAAAWNLKGTPTRQQVYASHPHPPDSDVEHLRRFFARTYYQFVYDTVKTIDPNHLYFGFWILPQWMVNGEDWRMIAPYCDVIGYDRYDNQFADAQFARLMKETNKPVLLGEFGFPAVYGLRRGFRAYFLEKARVHDDAEAGRKYTEWLEEGSTNPYCVGEIWFEYRDEPLSGRGPGKGGEAVYGEDFAFGLVDVGDRPKWDLVKAVRAANLAAARARLKARLAPAGR